MLRRALVELGAYVGGAALALVGVVFDDHTLTVIKDHMDIGKDGDASPPDRSAGRPPVRSTTYRRFRWRRPPRG
jgi:hypothetical protein